MIKAILIDDESNALDAMQDQLNEFKDIHIVGRFTNPLEALNKVKGLKADVVFLDIDMPGMTGLEAAEALSELDSELQIVFVTAYNQYAIDAFEVSALDYLLKPVKHERMQKTVKRLISHGSKENKKQPENQGRVTCFGSFSISLYKLEWEQVKWRVNKVKELFAYLVHHRNNGVHKERIVEDIWPDMEIEKAVVYLHTCIYQIRKMIKQYGLQQQLAVKYANDSYQLKMNGVDCDVDEFLQIIENESCVTDRNIYRYEQAAALYRGDYYEENDFFWAVHLKEKLLLVYLETLKRMVEYYLQQKNHTRALHHLQHIIMKNPLREEYHELLLQVYADMGDRLALREHFIKMEALFMEELGIAVKPSTKNLYDQLYGQLSR